MTSLTRLRKVAGAITVVILLLGLIHNLTLPTSTLWQRTLVDLGHVPVFAIIAYALLKLALARHRRITEYPVFQDYLHTGLAVLLLAVLSEASQLVNPGRSASLSDVFRNCAGGALTLLASVIFRRQAASGEHAHLRTLYLLVGFALFAALLAPIISVTAAYLNRSANWPTIIGNNYRFERSLSVAYRSNLQVVSVPDKWRIVYREDAYRVQLLASADSGILLQELDGDWGEFTQACVEITNPDSSPLQARVEFGTHPMFFRSTSFRKTPLSIAGETRTARCVHLEHTDTFESVEGAANPARYRSLALIARDTNEVRTFLLHRIWLQ